jgi:hypothetical protein
MTFLLCRVENVILCAIASVAAEIFSFQIGIDGLSNVRKPISLQLQRQKIIYCWLFYRAKKENNKFPRRVCDVGKVEIKSLMLLQ